MRRPILLALVSLCAFVAIPTVAAASWPVGPAGAAAGAPTARTVTATGVGLVPPPADPVSVFGVQLQGQIDQTDPARTLDAYRAKLERIRQAVIGAGVPEGSVGPASFDVQPNGAGGAVWFNSIFRYEVRPGDVSVAAAQAAFAAGATMVYNNMPFSGLGVRKPDSAELDRAIADATAMARDYATRANGGRAVGEAVATTLVVNDEPANAPTSWRVEATITFEAR